MGHVSDLDEKFPVFFDVFVGRLLLLFLFGFQWNVDVHSQLLAAKTKQLEWKLQHNNKEGANFYQKQNIKSTSCSYLLFVLFKEADDGGGIDVITRLIIAHQQLGLEENLQDLLQRLLKDNNNKTHHKVQYKMDQSTVKEPRFRIITLLTHSYQLDLCALVQLLNTNWIGRVVMQKDSHLKSGRLLLRNEDRKWTIRVKKYRGDVGLMRGRGLTWSVYRFLKQFVTISPFDMW